MRETTHRVRRSRRMPAVIVALAAVVVVGCSGDDDEGPTASDCYDTFGPLARYTVVNGLYQAGAVTTADIQSAADTVGLSDSDFATYFGEGSGFPPYDAMMDDQRLFDVVVKLANDNSVTDYRDLYEERCQNLYAE